ncbi:helix-turn-helix domain-containing protein [Streptomyces sp. NPDC101221]|uniref:AlbA family DNA-binding domain-containing protein n=1 Tax=Streptomyces sp. NPDC101221 TaxID=3366132 RepID=UPI00382EE060
MSLVDMRCFLFMMMKSSLSPTSSLVIFRISQIFSTGVLLRVAGKQVVASSCGGLCPGAADRLAEFDDLDWKEHLPQPPRDGRWNELAKDVAAMANTRGGLIVFGVRDTTCELVGIRQGEHRAVRPLDPQPRPPLGRFFRITKVSCWSIRSMVRGANEGV